ncbi:hypothetical protein K438DRAFT_791236 [Mycena galopus ATCC 62051]|nr:hypothetical protein K438DRAFT_791236 [Mycena galopus ATCC 62051]
MLKSSSHTGRPVIVQHMVADLTTFFFSSRASSLGATHQKWLTLEYNPTLRDLTIYCYGKMQWEIDFRIRFFKTAINTPVGQEQTFRISGVLRAHNALFDLTVALMAHLWIMGAFKKKYETPEELLEDVSRAQIELDPDMLDLPLFRKSVPGGREFVDPPEAAMSRSFYDSFRYWAGEAGLPRAGYGALRRDTGNLYGLQMGRRIAKDILNHHDQGPFRTSYSLNMENYKLVNIRLGEVAGTKESVPSEKLMAHEEQHTFKSYAVEALIRSNAQKPEEKADTQKIRDNYRDKLKESPPLKELYERRQSAWTNYLKCFNKTAQGYVPSTANANKIMARATGDKVLKKEDSTPLAFQAPWNKTRTDPISSPLRLSSSKFRNKK